MTPGPKCEYICIISKENKPFPFSLSINTQHPAFLLEQRGKKEEVPISVRLLKETELM